MNGRVSHEVVNERVSPKGPALTPSAAALTPSAAALTLAAAALTPSAAALTPSATVAGKANTLSPGSEMLLAFCSKAEDRESRTDRQKDTECPRREYKSKIARNQKPPF